VPGQRRHHAVLVELFAEQVSDDLKETAHRLFAARHVDLDLAEAGFLVAETVVEDDLERTWAWAGGHWDPFGTGRDGTDGSPVFLVLQSD
jgi:hypothetical protein